MVHVTLYLYYFTNFLFIIVYKKIKCFVLLYCPTIYCAIILRFLTNNIISKLGKLFGGKKAHHHQCNDWQLFLFSYLYNPGKFAVECQECRIVVLVEIFVEKMAYVMKWVKLWLFIFVINYTCVVLTFGSVGMIFINQF